MVDYHRFGSRQDLALAHSQIGNNQAADWGVEQLGAHCLRPGVLAPSQYPDLNGMSPLTERPRQQGTSRQAIRIVVPEDQHGSISPEPVYSLAEGLLNNWDRVFGGHGISPAKGYRPQRPV